MTIHARLALFQREIVCLLEKITGVALSQRPSTMSAQVLNLNITVDKENNRDGLLKVLAKLRPAWKEDDIKIEPLQQGFINHMVLCKANENKDEWLVARIFGIIVEGFMQNRQKELIHTKLMADLKIGPPLYATFTNGLVSGFAKGKSYFWTDLSAFKDTKLLKSVARAMAKMHCEATRLVAVDEYGVEKARTMMDVLSDCIHEWPKVIVNEETTKWFNSEVPTQEERRKELELVFGYMQAMMDGRYGDKIPFCHNDCNPTNIIYDEENDHVTFVDFEMCGLGEPLADLGNFLISSAIGFAPDPQGLYHSPEVSREVVLTYLEEINKHDNIHDEVMEEQIQDTLDMVEVVAIAQLYFFHVALAKLANIPERSLDPKMFLGMSIARLKCYWRDRARMFELLEKLKNKWCKNIKTDEK
ncbi:ethanolamine kinase 1-like isoform X1 [Lineus longissimus]|uniref:ethanolamine kinase 1-like isoform X1 n=1 Tax=Lineus longissimus TaxID=88925 RepID=UPI00315DBD56